jgi:alpha-L-fucosidase
MDWESCMTMNGTWGFKSDDQNWKTAETLIRNLIDIASKGGNYLLNVGPTAEGLIPQPSVERLARMGQWMKVNGESIYGTQASPFEKTPWGRCTQKELPDGTTRLYLHVFQRPADGKLTVSSLPTKATKSFLLDGGQKLEFTAQGTQVLISLPEKLPDAVASVVVLELAPTRK